MMIAIFDRISPPKKFPLSKLLSVIESILGSTYLQCVAIHRLGGVGSGIWKYESQLDEGGQLIIPYSDVQKLAESTKDCADELFCSVGFTYFGISDSSFMFIQCQDKEAELQIAAHFASFRQIPDIKPPGIADPSPPTSLD